MFNCLYVYMCVLLFSISASVTAVESSRQRPVNTSRTGWTRDHWPWRHRCLGYSRCLRRHVTVCDSVMATASVVMATTRRCTMMTSFLVVTGTAGDGTDE